jgi:hypothetical protein
VRRSQSDIKVKFSYIEAIKCYRDRYSSYKFNIVPYIYKPIIHRTRKLFVQLGENGVKTSGSKSINS